MDTLKIFISGTQDDLRPQRQVVAAAVRALRHKPVMAETYGTQPMPSISAIREMIESADIYIGVYGARYGRKMDHGVSVTEFEFTEFRRKYPNRILIYVKETAPEPEQAAFLQRVQDFKEGYFRRPKFRNPNQLADWVREDLAAFITRVVREKLRGTPEPALIRAYLEQVAAQKPYILWTDQTYIDRIVVKSGDLFSRTVARFDPHAWKEENQPEPLEAVLGHTTKLVLLGEPGAGKTTSLLHLVWEVANRTLATLGEGEIPIYVELKHYTGEPELEGLLARRVNQLLRGAGKQPLAFDLEESARILKVWLAQSDARFLILLDGLNEVRPEFHTHIRDVIKDLLELSHRLIISCRERDYDASLRDQAPAFVLQGLQEKEILKYLEQMVGEQGIRIFEEQIRYDYKMRTLVANPLMLWLISTVAQVSPDAQLPANRGKLFWNFITRMPRVRASEGIPIEIPPDVITAALAKLGYEMQEREQLAADLGEIRRWGIPTANHVLENVLTQAKDWRFLKSDGRMGERVEFTHQLFLEYFAAAQLNEELHHEREYVQVLGEKPFGPRWFRTRWDEVLVMLAGISDQPVELVKWLSARVVERKQGNAAFLVRRCFETTDATGSAAVRSLVIDAQIVALLDTMLETSDRQDAAEALGEIGDPRSINVLLDVFRDELGKKEYNRYLLTSYAYALGKLTDTRSINVLADALQNPEVGEYERGWIVQALGRVLSNSKKTNGGEENES